jgi:flagellar basal-body rod protein FlgG
MLENLNIAASGMLAQQQRIDAVANDLANASTTGYKHTRVGFKDLVYTDAGRSQTGGVRLGAGVATVDAGRAFDQGALQNTGNPLDVAIQGEGFLTVKLPDGRTALTRDGALRTDGRGRLTTSTGALLQPPVTIPSSTAADQVAIGRDGTISADGRRIGRLNVVTVRSPQAMLSAGDNAFIPTAASGAAVRAPAATQVSQGVLESSNVDMADEMVEMIDAQRSYQLASKAISTADEMAQIANGLRR